MFKTEKNTLEDRFGNVRKYFVLSWAQFKSSCVCPDVACHVGVYSCCSRMRSVRRLMSLTVGWHCRIMIITLSWSGNICIKLCRSFSVSSAVLSLTSWPLPWPPGVQSRYCSTSVWARGAADGGGKDADTPANEWLPGTGKLLWEQRHTHTHTPWGVQHDICYWHCHILENISIFASRGLLLLRNCYCIYVVRFH